MLREKRPDPFRSLMDRWDQTNSPRAAGSDAEHDTWIDVPDAVLVLQVGAAE